MSNIELTPTECQTLEDELVFLPHDQRGKRKISASFLADSVMPSPSSSLSSSSSSSTASVRYIPSKIQKDTVVPEKLESAEALEFIGLEPDTASEIFNRWDSRPDPKYNPNSLLDLVYGHTCQLRRNSWNNYSDEEACDRLGIAPWLKEAILNPRYSGIYLTKELKHWLDKSMRTNYNALARILSQLKTHATVRGQGKKKQKRASLGEVFPGAPGAASSSATMTELSQGVASMSTASVTSHFPQAHVFIRDARPTLPDHDVFYKAKAVEELSTDTAFITASGKVDMDVIQSYPGGDFNPRYVAWYFTAEKETAYEYKAYAELRCPYGEVWIISIQVPKSFTATLRKEELWYSYDWKAYVWHCKKRHKADAMPERYHKFWMPGPKRTDLMIGHVCKGVSCTVARIAEDKVQTEMTEDNVIMIGPNKDTKASQWVLMHEEVAERLAEVIRGKIHVEVHVGRRPEAK
ncbi:hypothetical protein IWZ03DRAFT_377486 [Phyllosticta citriasiana]|uniref:Uncharacterized protein n=1 Tax=Phyllosticta citriasiana TaxID=595635 RepID=A0ABR1KN68_9PEZI